MLSVPATGKMAELLVISCVLDDTRRGWVGLDIQNYVRDFNAHNKTLFSPSTRCLQNHNFE